MTKFLAVFLLGGAAMLQMQTAAAQSELVATPPATESAIASANVSLLPPLPRGKSTILGGEIRDVDPIRDQLTLRVFGQKRMKILFDERTQIFLDGKRIPLSKLGATGDASVQTTLDGANVYAINIHMLSHSPEGDYQGRVLRFDPDTRELTLSGGVSREPVKLLVPLNTPIIRQGQKQFTDRQAGDNDLAKGALVSIQFESGAQGKGIASHVAVLATPGAAFIFSGTVESLDMHSGTLVLVDPRDDQSYQVSFDPARLPQSRKLHEGDRLRITADFDGIRYVATELAQN